ncbi:MAG: long-chain-fatty-acid--CoA ligase [Oscillochloridaceae bacterium umkhey_bin13]
MSEISFGDVWLAPLSPRDFLARSVRVFPDRVAVIYGEQRLTYTDLDERVRRFAAALRGLGVGPGDRVAFLCPNTPPLLEAHLACPILGAVLVAINTRLSTDEVGYILGHSGAKVVCVDTELSHLVAPHLGTLPALETVVTIADEVAGAPGARLDGPDYEALVASATPMAWAEAPPVRETDTLSINYTSGTTGQPKGVMYSHRGGALNAMGEIIHAGLDTNSVYLWTLPMFHCNGWCFTWAVTAAGGAHLCLRRFEPAAVVRLITAHHATHLCAAPTVLIMLLNNPAISELQLTVPLHIVTAAAPPSPTVLAAIEALGARITHVYGLTETYGPHVICDWHPEWDSLPAEQRARLKSRQGVPYLNAMELRVVDDQMNDVPADGATLGEVVMRGNNVMKGYYLQDEATAHAFRGGWFHSGDVGVMHPNGYIELRDRAKDIIISGGENISTIEVEQTLYQHEAVLEVAVVARPDELWGEVPVAFVTLKPGGELTEAELIAFCRQHLAGYKCPRSIIFGDLPKTSTGKVQKFRLRERFWEGKERGIN